MYWNYSFLSIAGITEERIPLRKDFETFMFMLSMIFHQMHQRRLIAWIYIYVNHVCIQGDGYRDRFKYFRMSNFRSPLSLKMNKAKNVIEKFNGRISFKWAYLLKHPSKNNVDNRWNPMHKCIEKLRKLVLKLNFLF